MKQSVYDLAFDFIEQFFGDRECPADIKRNILDFMSDLLYSGFTTEEIVQRWTSFSVLRPGVMPKLRDLYVQKPREKNLLDSMKFYYHNLLQIVPGPPMRDVDYNTGVITKIDEPYFLEIRSSLTIEQLVEYYADQMRIGLTVSDMKRYIGVFNWLLKNHEIEDILFMIDTAANIAFAEDNGVVEPVKLGEYKLKAVAAKMAKVTEIRQAGDEHVVPKTRILSSRRRRENNERIHPQPGYASV